MLLLAPKGTTTAEKTTPATSTAVEIFHNHIDIATEAENEQQEARSTPNDARAKLPLLAPAADASTSQILTYHNLCVPSPNSSNGVGVGVGGGGGATEDLGLWSLAVVHQAGGDANNDNANNNVAAHMLMKSVVVPNLKENCNAAPCFVVNVDLADASRVCSTIRSSIDIIVKALLADADETNDVDANANANANGGKEAAAATNLSFATTADNVDLVEMKNRYTSLTALQMNVFGELGTCSVRSGSNKKSSDNVGGVGVYDKYVALVLAVCLPTKPSSSYQDEQAQALIMYHLYRFALHVNCVVTFVQKQASSTSTSTPTTSAPIQDAECADAVASMDVDCLRDVVVQIASGISPRDVKVNNNNSALKDVANGDTHTPPAEIIEETSLSSLALVTPGSIDSTLVENTMLANANCEGQWDASVDSLPKALPEQTIGRVSVGHTKASSSEASTKAYSDDEWLSKLASTMKTIEAIPTAAIKEEPKSKTSAKKDVAVSSFFENLLKK